MGILCITSGHIASTKFKVVLHGLRFDGLSVLGDNWLNYRPVTYQTIGRALRLCASRLEAWLQALPYF